jgi:hypothetical protein
MMVMPYDEGRLLVVLQVDHSRVTGLFAAHWGNGEFAAPRPYAPMVLAAQEHDNGWWEWEVQPTLTAEGHPIDYVNSGLPREIWVEGYANGVQRIADRDPYAGLIACMHAIGLCNQGYGLLPYMQNRLSVPVVADFVREQDRLRLALLEQVRRSETYAPDATEDRLWTNFKLMEVYDQLGQFVCNRYPFNSPWRKNGPSRTLSDVPVPVAAGREDTRLTVEPVDESRAVIRPFPFDVDPLVVAFQGRLVSSAPYADRDTFLRDYYTAPRVNITYTLSAA